MKRGAYDYITKPLDLEKLEVVLTRALHSRKVESENRQLREELDKKFGLEKLIGNSPAMVEIYDRVRQVAPTRATVLIEGESGTGKELVAQSLHMLSPRKRRPLRRRSIARRSRRNCSRANFSATRRAPSPARPSGASAASRRPTTARSSSTRSARSTPPRR